MSASLFSRYRLIAVQLKAKWKGLRDMFRVEYKRIPRDDSGELIMEPYEFASKWIYYKPLLFLGKAKPYFQIVNLLYISISSRLKSVEVKILGSCFTIALKYITNK